MLAFVQVRILLWDMFVGMDTTWQLTFELAWIGLVGVIFAGLLAPLEALGWWAGWYGDEIDMTLNP
ncbi:hypothetical protein [Leptothermofonsia sp. ETS-13]|uniref:hypothetical protein n=1 Tax=Leptothermofonsia sp. ETS-13 TaxID=3035696 RepID=UPI003B9E221B